MRSDEQVPAPAYGKCVRAADDSRGSPAYGDHMTSINHFALRHRRLVALAWILLTVAGVLTVSSATGNLAHGFNTLGTPGYEANAHLLVRFGIDGNEQPTIAVLRLPVGDGMGTAAGRAAAARTFAAAARAGHLAVADYANTHNPKLISRDGRTTWALIDVPNPDIPLGSGVVERIEPALHAAAPAGASVAVTGFEQLQSNGGGGGGPSVLIETLIAAAGALAVLLFVYGSAIAIVPLLIALPSILTSFLLVLALEQAISVNFLVEYLVAVMGLGIAVDYSLLMVTRWREEREAGRSNQDAIIAAGPTAGRAVVLSGTIVAIGLLSLVVLPVPFLRSIGLGAMLIPLVAIAASVTLLPVILATWGPTLDKHRVVRSGSTTYSHGWERWANVIVRHRWVAGAIGLAIVVGLAIPALSMNTGQPRANSLGGHGQPAQTLHALERQGVPSAVVFPIQLLTHGGPAAARRATAIANATPDVYTVLAPATASFRHGHDALISVIPTAEGNTTAGTATVTRLRAAFAGVPDRVEVGGNTAQNIDFNNAVYGNFPLMLALIAIVTCLILARAFRSVVLAIKAVLVNIVSLGATFGFMVLFWQNGHGSNLIYGVPATGSIRNWIPIIAFAFLFGISMDYEVFILARMREEYDRTGSTQEAVVGSLAHTGRLVTCGALILAISFASLSTAPDIVVEMIATALAFGVLLDAFIVRTLLVPALVAIMGRWNWWMPHTLARLLRLAPPPPGATRLTRESRPTTAC
jgi:putative drug exporter of the RND superfamily